MRSSTTPLRRATLASVTALALAAALVGCGDSDDKGDATSSPSAADVVVLDENQATTALLTLTNVGEPFKLDESDDSAAAPGCLSAAEKLVETGEAKANVFREFSAEAGTDQAGVTTRVISFESTEAAQQALDNLLEEMKDCSEIDEPFQGAQAKIEVETDDDKGSVDVDQRVNISAVGTLSDATDSVELGQWASIARVDNNLSILVITQNASSKDFETDPPLEVALDRLEAVVDGKTPDESVVID